MSVLAANSHMLYREVHHKEQLQQSSFNGSCLLMAKSYGFGIDSRKGGGGGGGGGGGERRKIGKRDLRVEASWLDMSRPAFVEMVAINDSDHLDQILLNSQHLSQTIIIDWMAAWCRKCIYLKPKLEKLAAEFDTKIKFYCVDVNKVPQSLVKRGNISKMPTIQLWKDGEMKAEVIGGHKAWLVIDEVREMIQKFV